MFAEEYVLSDLYFSTVIGEYEYEVGALLYRNERLHAPHHWHEGLEFQLNVAGDVIYEIEDKTYRVSDHNYVIIGANVGHRETVVIKETKVAQPQSYCISFKTNRIRKAHSKIANLVREDEFIHDVLSSVNHLVGEYDDSTARLFDDMLEEIQSQQPGYYTRGAQALLAEILVDIVRYCRPMANSSRSNHIKPIRKSPDDSKFEITPNFSATFTWACPKTQALTLWQKSCF